MIDWLHVGMNALWIAGLAVVLATFSYHRWLAVTTSRRLRDLTSHRSWKLPFASGMTLTCLGLGYGLGFPLWQRAVWTVLAGSYAWQAALAMRRRGDGIAGS